MGKKFITITKYEHTHKSIYNRCFNTGIKQDFKNAFHAQVCVPSQVRVISTLIY